MFPHTYACTYLYTHFHRHVCTYPSICKHILEKKKLLTEEPMSPYKRVQTNSPTIPWTMILLPGQNSHGPPHSPCNKSCQHQNDRDGRPSLLEDRPPEHIWVSGSTSLWASHTTDIALPFSCLQKHKPMVATLIFLLDSLYTGRWWILFSSLVYVTEAKFIQS